MFHNDSELCSYLGGNRSARRFCSQLDAQRQERFLQTLAVQDLSKDPRLQRLFIELQSLVPQDGPILALPNDILREIGKHCSNLTSILAVARTCKALYAKSIFLLLFNHQALSKYLTRAISQPDEALLLRTLTALDGCDVSGIFASLTISVGEDKLPERARRLSQHFQLSLDFCINPITHSYLENWLRTSHSVRALNVYAPLSSVTYSKLALPADLQRLSVHAERMVDEGFFGTVQRLPKLKVFELATQHANSVSARDFAAASWQQTLERIVLGRSQMRKDGLEKMFTSCPNLKELVLKVASWLNAEDFQASEFPPQLEVLELHSLDIADAGFLKIMARCQKLQRLVVRDCINISPEAFARAQYAKTLKVVDFQGTSLDDRALHHICSSVAALQCINVDSCEKITVEGILELQVPPTLEYITGYKSLLEEYDWFALYCASHLSEGTTALYARAFACLQSSNPEREGEAYSLLERTLALNHYFVTALNDLGMFLLKTALDPQEKERGQALLEKAHRLLSY